MDMITDQRESYDMLRKQLDEENVQIKLELVEQKIKTQKIEEEFNTYKEWVAD